VGEDGWQSLIVGRELDISKLAQSEELIFESIASIVPTEITFKKLVWVSEFRCVCLFYMCQYVFNIGFIQAQYPHGK
jgi:hypothetical protein